MHSDPEDLAPLIRLYNQGQYAHVLAALAGRDDITGSSFEANHLRAAALFQLGQPGEALIRAEKAREIRPESFAIHTLLFDIYREREDRIRAQRILETLLSLNPEHPETIFRTFKYHKMCHNLREGRHSLEKLRAAKPKDMKVLRLCALIDPDLVSDDDMSFLQERALDGSPDDRIRAEFSLGQVHLARGEFSQAQPCFDRANKDVLKTGAGKDRFGQVTELWLSSPFGKEFFETRARPDNRSRDVLVLGASRSGKSVLETAICELCGAQALGEAALLSDFVETCPGREKSKIWTYLTDSSDEVIRKDADRLDRELRAISADLKVHTRPGDIFHLPLLSLWKREMPIIFMTRRLYDQAISIYLKKYSQPNELFCSLEGAVRYVYLYNKLARHFRQVLPNPMAFVSYDGFVRNPAGVAKQVAGFVGADDLDWTRFETALLSEAADSPGFLPSGGMDASTRVTSKFRYLEHAFPDYKSQVDMAVEKLREEGADMRLLDLENDDTGQGA